MSILEEGTISIVAPIMGVFNNLVVFDPNVKQNSLKSIVPDLAESWSWSEDGTELTFKLRDGVKWHDGKPVTGADGKCTFGLVQGQPVDQGGAQPGLLETRPPLSRRRRVDDHPEPLHRDARFHGRAVRHDLSLRGHDPNAEGRAQPDAPGDL